MADSEEDPAPSSPASKLSIYLLIIGGVSVAVLGAYQILLTSSPGDEPIGVADHRATTVRESRLAPNFTLPDLESGAPIRLDAFRGQIVVLNVWASWCLPCRDEAPALQAAWENYRGRGVQFLGSNYRDDRDAARAFVGEFGITYPSVFDPSGRLAADYGFFGLPSTFVIDQAGRIRFQFTGYLTASILRGALDELLSGVRG
jgi:cytochrome c biogenesis protein CcmG, thiol:disulfide interchange protein DsbE